MLKLNGGGATWADVLVAMEHDPVCAFRLGGRLTGVSILAADVAARLADAARALTAEQVVAPMLDTRRN
jgi:hypothetical protein